VQKLTQFSNEFEDTIFDDLEKVSFLNHQSNLTSQGSRLLYSKTQQCYREMEKDPYQHDDLQRKKRESR